MSVDGKAFLAQLNDLSAALRNNAIQALKASVKAAEEDARSSTLFKGTGALRNATRGTVDSTEMKGELKANTKYARFVEDGTPPHVIEAQGGALRFVINGRVVFARRVNHPGTAPRPFMQHASDVGEKTLDYGLDYFTDYAISKFNSQK